MLHFSRLAVAVVAVALVSSLSAGAAEVIVAGGQGGVVGAAGQSYYYSPMNNFYSLRMPNTQKGIGVGR